MEFEEYQIKTGTTAIYPDEGEVAGVSAAVIYTASGVSGEAGEIAGKVKKAMREDEDKYLTEIEAEMGDLLWYIARLADELDLNLEEVASKNLEKLQDRQERGELTGSGDHR